MVTTMRLALSISLLGICFILLSAGTVHAATTSPSIAISSSAGYVGSKVTVTGAGYPPSATLNIEWNSANANWNVGSSPPQVTGTTVTPDEKVLGSTQTNSSGGFSAQITLPPDFGMQHFIQAYAANGTAYAPKATYTLEPQFSFSPTSGPAGTPITVTGTGMGDGLYSTNYHVSWDNNYVGYATAITTGGSTTFTIYASGVPGTHYVAVYQGYPGPGYLNAEQIPVASQSQSYFPPGCVVLVSCTMPYYANFTVTAPDPPTAGSSSGMAISGAIVSVPLLITAAAIAGSAVFVSRQDPERRRAISRSMAAIVVIVVLAVAGVALFATASQGASTVTSTVTSTVSAAPPTTSSTSSSSSQISFTPVATTDRPNIVVPVYSNATTGPRISVTPTIVSVGGTITVTGAGFTPNTQLPLTWSTRQGSNLLGYKLVALPLKNVTTDGNGAFTLTQKVHSDVGGVHFIAAGNLTERSNGTVFLQRSG